MIEPDWRPVAELTRDPRQSRVWRVERDGATAVLKAHQSAGKYHRERDALRRFAPHPWAPRLLAVDDPGHRLLIEDRAGRPGDTPEDLRRAGEALAALHATPEVPPDPLPLPTAIERRLAAALRHADPHLPPATRRAVAARVGDGAAFRGVHRVWCHRDFAPRNWLVADRFTLIDYEHTAPDDPLVDLVRLYDGPLIDRPDREAAFWRGYGGALTPAARDRLDRLLALHALVTATWGRRHRDPHYTCHGDALLTRLGLQ